MAAVKGHAERAADLQKYRRRDLYCDLHRLVGIDGRIADIDFEGGGSGNAAVSTPGGYTIPYQITLSNLYSNGNNGAYSWAQCAQCGIIESVETSMKGGIGTFLNFNENNPDELEWQQVQQCRLSGADRQPHQRRERHHERCGRRGGAHLRGPVRCH